MTGGPSLACGGFAACRRYGGYYIPIILALQFAILVVPKGR